MARKRTLQKPPKTKVFNGVRHELFNVRTVYGGLTDGLARTGSENEAAGLRKHGFKARSVRIGDSYCVYAKYR